MKLKTPDTLQPMCMYPWWQETPTGRRQQAEHQQALERERAPLTEQQSAEVQCNILLMRDTMPELEDFVKELAKEGMIHGWRSLQVILK